MKKEFFFPSCGQGQIHCNCWVPQGQVKAVVQILHGIAEYSGRYEAFAEHLNALGYLVVAEDHMGHGLSVSAETTQGYFAGGWFSAVADSYELLCRTQKEYPHVPYILFGHSMGSFMTRTLLAQYPDSGIAGAVICGTGWMNPMVLKTGRLVCKNVCRRKGEKSAHEGLSNLVFSGYNSRTEKRTDYDWLNRDPKAVDAYLDDPLCGFTATAGLLRDMLTGILHIQKKETLNAMDKKLPVLFIAGGADPVGGYGKGVLQAAKAFRGAGMEQVDTRIFPDCRHEILNEENRQEVWDFVTAWLAKIT